MGRKEKFWLDESDPSELRRRALDLYGDGLFECARMLERRAAFIETTHCYIGEERQ